ncbi:hypothetical protein QE418_003428 [Microbacterium testaceum]|uniref:hypothetical protein n=1 Tax=Microbacterium TaxID=33882 RepID=UPI002782B024|nr:MULTISPECIES: hypothetical protein [Microbacterium]MDQ1113980.1 hypothetical protein [Microbacterium testaceum]MDR6098914.1 hypothetical protein [Microbacterium sp. SORGH_AS_0454]
MSTTPRTPLFWPRMKVRSIRHREKLAARHETRTIVPMMRLSQPSPSVLRLVAVTTWEPGTYSVETRTVRDGYGRQIGRAMTTARPVSNPTPPKPIDLMDALLMSFRGVSRLRSAEGAPPDAP